MKTKSTSLALLIAAGLLSSTDSASAYTTYGNTVVNGTNYDLSPFANLTNANLENANLSYAYLRYTNLTNANLYNTNLRFAYLYAADLTNANLTNAYLYAANLSNADLTGANLSNANLSNADLTGANLSNANLTNAYLTGAILSNANLTNAYLTGAYLTGDLSYATVSYSNWTDFSNNSGAQGLGSYSYDTSLINYAGSTPVPEPSTYGLIGIGALGVAFAARRKKQKSV